MADQPLPLMDAPLVSEPEPEPVAPPPPPAPPAPIESPAMPSPAHLTIERLLEMAVHHEATDLHLVVGYPPTYRIHGDLRPLKSAPLEPQDVRRLAHEMNEPQVIENLERGTALDFSHVYAGREEKRRCRGNIAHEVKGMAISIRLLPFRIPSLEEIGLSMGARELIKKTEGLIIVAGPTGSGKSTTMASMLADIAVKDALKIVTIEQPIEYYFNNESIPHSRSIFTQIEVPRHVSSFGEALHNSLRQDPDVIMIGEAREFETIKAAVDAANTGHLVFVTLHTKTAADSIDRVVNLCPEDQQREFRITLSSTLLGVISQRLLPRIDKGLVMAHELMLNNGKVQECIYRGDVKGLSALVAGGSILGMESLDEYLYRLIKQKMVSAEEALRVAQNSEALKRRLSGYRQLGHST